MRSAVCCIRLAAIRIPDDVERILQLAEYSAGVWNLTPRKEG
jgi:hypothetical protein